MYQTHRICGSDGTSLYVVEAGNPQGRPILFLHGLSQSHAAWKKQLTSELAQEFHLVAPDLRGHGLSDKPLDAYESPKLWADDLRAIMQTLCLKQPVYCAWSFGTRVVGDYLQVYGDSDLAGIQFVSSVPGDDVTDETWSHLEPLLLADETAEEGAAALVRCLTYQEMNREEIDYFMQFNRQVPSYVRRALLSRPPLNTADLNVTKPVWITHGLQDRISLPATAELGKGLFQNARLSLYPGVGHAPFWENAERFNDELREFMYSLT